MRGGDARDLSARAKGRVPGGCVPRPPRAGVGKSDRAKRDRPSKRPESGGAESDSKVREHVQDDAGRARGMGADAFPALVPLTYLGDRESAANLSQGVEVSRSGYRGAGALSEGLGAAEPSVLEGALDRRRPPFQACAVVSGNLNSPTPCWRWKYATRPRPSDG